MSDLSVYAKIQIDRETSVAGLKKILSRIPDYAVVSLDTQISDRQCNTGTTYFMVFRWIDSTLEDE